ncbi:MAG: hypothetical protein GY696_23760, partial [Gammaproteobacteria bacterium]|nr:hypothetical protein [Gammaproteobacteria bacterium]
PFGLATRALRAHPPNWIQTNLAPRGETKPVGLIESGGAPPRGLGRSPKSHAPPGPPLLATALVDVLFICVSVIRMFPEYWTEVGRN